MVSRSAPSCRLDFGLERRRRGAGRARAHGGGRGRHSGALRNWGLSPAVIPAHFDDATSRFQMNRLHLVFRMPISLPHGFARRDRCRRQRAHCRRHWPRAGQVLISWWAYTTDRRTHGELAHRSEHRRWRCPIRDSNLRLISLSWSSRAYYCARRGPLVIVDYHLARWSYHRGCAFCFAGRRTYPSSAHGCSSHVCRLHLDGSGGRSSSRQLAPCRGATNEYETKVNDPQANPQAHQEIWPQGLPAVVDDDVHPRCSLRWRWRWQPRRRRWWRWRWRP